MKPERTALLSLQCLWDGAAEPFPSAQMQPKTGLRDQTGHVRGWQSWIRCWGTHRSWQQQHQGTISLCGLPDPPPGIRGPRQTDAAQPLYCRKPPSPGSSISERPRTPSNSDASGCSGSSAFLGDPPWHCASALGRRRQTLGRRDQTLGRRHQTLCVAYLEAKPYSRRLQTDVITPQP